MNWPIAGVVVQPIKCQIGDDPVGNLAHVLILNDEIAGRTTTLADADALQTILTGGMLVKFWRDPLFYISRKFCG